MKIINTKTVLLAVVGLAALACIFAVWKLHTPTPAISDDGKVLLCGGIPNGSTQNVIETTRMFINLPRDVYPDKEHNLQPKTISGNVTAGRMPARDTGEDLEATLECWSYRFDFNGIGEVDLTAKSGMKNASDYVVHFIVVPHPQDIITTPTKQ